MRISRASSLGVYFDQKQIYLIALEKRKQQLSLHYAETIAYDIAEDQQIIAQLRTLLQNKKIKPSYANIAILNLPIIQKDILFDALLHESDILATLQTEQENYFPDIASPLCFDIARQHSLKKSPTTTYQVFAVNQHLMNRYICLLQTANIQVNCLEPKDYALLRTLTYKGNLNFPSPSRAYLLIHPVNSHYEFLAFNQASIFFKENIPLQHNIASAYQNFMQLYTLNNFNEKLTKIFMTQFPHEQKIFPDSASIDIEFFAPFEKILIPKNVFGSKNKDYYLYALGLALRGFYDNT